ncbi:MAG TPA: GDSL-type esterase/lipase family protein [Thermoanaerobaculia bacterium]|nr:GDSL-type esterase/lipase family protein [Thermoanaerobaculia bacterium]
MILYHIYSGQLFFTAAALYLVGIFVPRLRVLALLAIPLALLSGTPMPWWFALPLLAVTVAGLIRRRSRMVRVLAAAGVLVAAAAEVPYQIGGAFSPPGRLIVIGDSLAAGGFAESQPWPHRLGVPVVNLARAADTAAGALSEQVPAMPPPTRGDVVIIEIGGNDMLDGLPARSFARALDQIVRAAAPREVVILEIPLLPGRWAYGAAQRRVAHRHGATLIPKRVLAKVLADPRNTDDGLHLTDRGHEALARSLLPRQRGGEGGRRPDEGAQ